jgi:hypothetical protein
VHLLRQQQEPEDIDRNVKAFDTNEQDDEGGSVEKSMVS